MDPTLHHGTLPLVISGPDEFEGDDGQLDTLSQTVLLSIIGSNWRAAAATAGYARKTQLAGYHSMWVRSLAKTNATDITAEVALDCIGLIASGEKRRRILGVGGREVAVGPFERIIILTEIAEGEDPDTSADEPVRRRVPKLNASGEVLYRTIVTPSGSADRWNIKDAFLTLTDTYFVAGATPPATNIIGTAQTPPTAPTPPTTPWGSYDEVLRGIHPNGWVLDDRHIEQHFFVTGTPDAGLWEVRDTYGFYYTAVPD